MGQSRDRAGSFASLALTDGEEGDSETSSPSDDESEAFESAFPFFPFPFFPFFPFPFFFCYEPNERDRRKEGPVFIPLEIIRSESVY